MKKNVCFLYHVSIQLTMTSIDNMCNDTRLSLKTKTKVNDSTFKTKAKTQVSRPSQGRPQCNPQGHSHTTFKAKDNTKANTKIATLTIKPKPKSQPSRPKPRPKLNSRDQAKARMQPSRSRPRSHNPQDQG